MTTSRITLLKKITCLCVLVMLIGASVPPKSTEAFGGGGGPVTVIGGPGSGADIKTSIESTISAAADTISSGLLFDLTFKENVLDGIFFVLAKHTLKAATNSLLNWINSGFKGKPLFVGDLDGFLLDVADETLGEFIQGTKLGFICSPFRLDVKIALNVKTLGQRNYQPTCKLSDISDNIEGFLAGDFSQGGWPGWFSITQSTNNNAAGAYLEAQAELEVAIKNAQGQKITLLSANDFFLNIEICDSAHSSAGNKQKCQTTTPGKVISEQLTFKLEGADRALIEADEINEVVGALFAQLAQQAITGTYGLLALGGDSQYRDIDRNFGSSGDLSYFEAITEEDTQIIFDQGDVASIPQAIEQEETIASLHTQIITRVSNIAKRFLDEDVTQYLVEDINGNVLLTCPEILDPTETPDQNRRNRITETLNQLYAFSSSSVAARDVARDSRAELVELDDRLLAATSSEAQLAVLDEFSDLRLRGKIGNPTAVTRLETFIDVTLANKIDEFRNGREEIDTKGVNDIKEECNASLSGP